MHRTIKSEHQDWLKLSSWKDEKKSFDTATPLLFFKMIEENITSKLSSDLTVKIFKMSITEVLNFAAIYKQGYIDFKETHLKKNKQVCREDTLGFVLLLFMF